MSSHAPLLRRRHAVALALLAPLAQAQTLYRPPPYEVLRWPAFYEARDLGRVAEGSFPVGCLSRSGAVYLNRAVDAADGDRPLTTATIYGWGGSEAHLTLFHILRWPSWVHACNRQGEIVGESSGHGGAVLWDIDWTIGPQRLGNVGTARFLSAINDQRVVVGAQVRDPNTNWATRWTTRTAPHDGVSTETLLFPGSAADINAAGQIVGASFLPNQPTRAVWMSAPAAQAVAIPLPAHASSVAHKVDDNGRVAGMLKDAAGVQRAFLWHATEGLALLQPAYANGALLRDTEARAIGADRTVFGRSFNGADGAPSRSTATVWLNAGAPRNLNHEASLRDGSAPPQLVTVVGVSDSGAVLCEARKDNVRHAVLLTPRPGGRWSRVLVP